MLARDQRLERRRQAARGYKELKDDGSTSCGCWIYCGVRADEVNQAAPQETPLGAEDYTALEWAWAWPANRRILYNRASADPGRQAVVGAQAVCLVGRPTGKWTGLDVPDFGEERGPTTFRPKAPKARRDRRRPPVHHAGRRPRLALRPARASSTALSRRTTSRTSHHSRTSSTDRRRTRRGNGSTGQRIPRNVRSEDGDDRYPFVVTTYRLTEHHTAGGMSRTVPYLAELQPEMFVEVHPELAELRGLAHKGWATIITSAIGDRGTRAGHRADEAAACRRTSDPPGRPALSLGLSRARAAATAPTTSAVSSSTRTCTSRRSRRSPATSGRGAVHAGARSQFVSRIATGDRDDERAGCDGCGRPSRSSSDDWAGGYGMMRAGLGSSPTHRSASAAKPARLPARNGTWSPKTGSTGPGESYDNTSALGANTWRHVAFIEQQKPLRLDGEQAELAGDALRWLMSSDVCKHCTHAACLDVCPTGALIRTEFGTVVVQEDICNGCGYCVPACPFGVIDRRTLPDLAAGRVEDGRVWKCTLCYDRLKDDHEPACAKACPTQSIQFGPLEELRERAGTAREAAGRGLERRAAVRREP